MYCDGWIRATHHFSSMCGSSPLNPKVIFYDVHEIYFDDRKINVFWGHQVQYLILKSDYSVHNHPDDNEPNLRLKKLFGNEKI